MKNSAHVSCIATRSASTRSDRLDLFAKNARMYRALKENQHVQTE
jgi:hypothetical protein